MNTRKEVKCISGTKMNTKNEVGACLLRPKPPKHIWIGETTLKRKSKFMQVKGEKMITVKCPECDKSFGLDTDFVTWVNGLNYVFTCPYCGKKHLLKND